MKTSQFVRLEKQVMPQLSFALQVQGRLSFLVPVSGVLRGFYFEPSAFNRTSFYVNAFVLPLCVPTDRLHLTYGHRIGADKRWDITDGGLVAKLKQVLQSELNNLIMLNSPARVAEVLGSMSRSGNPHTLEAYAYLLIQAGLIDTATGAMNDLLRLCDPGISWQQPIIARVEALKAKLSISVREAQSQLAVWEDTSVANLGLAESVTSQRTETSAARKCS